MELTIEELSNKPADEVRRNPSLVLVYIDLFKKEFGYSPSCIPCSFTSDWNKLKQKYLISNKNTLSLVSNLKSTQMETTFQLNTIKVEIFAFKQDGKTLRQYDNKMTEDFAVGYLTNGDPETLKERRKQFKILPEALRKSESKKEEVIEPVKEEKTEVVVTATEDVKEPENASKDATEYIAVISEEVIEPVKEETVKKTGGRPKKSK